MKVEMQENEFIKDMEKIITILFGPGVNMLPDHQVSPIAGPEAVLQLHWVFCFGYRV